MPLEIPAPSDRDTIDHARRWRARTETLRQTAEAAEAARRPAPTETPAP